MEKTPHHFDYVIIGGGMAGLQLAMSFAKDLFFDDVSIALIEPSDKIKNDRTWCFWEENKESKWDLIIHHEWKKGLVKDRQEQLNLEMDDYVYRMIRSEDFYRLAHQKIDIAHNVVWIKDEILAVEGSLCIGKNEHYEADFIFDSRVDPQYLTDKKSININQHFKGWLIETEEDCFDPQQFSMMDFSLQYEDLCCFTYVLPTSKRKALVEFTFFTPDMVSRETYDKLLHQYITEELRITDYKIVEDEFGVIPMSTYTFEQHNTNSHIKIGTAGGWVKASSGYTFKSTEKKVAQLVANLKYEEKLERGLFVKKYKFYDRILLRVLRDENHLGSRIFKEMYTKNKASQIFKFLDEETNLIEEFKIINGFRKAPFLRSLRKEIR